MFQNLKYRIEIISIFFVFISANDFLYAQNPDSLITEKSFTDYYAVFRGTPSQAEEKLIPGRVFSRIWYLPDGYWGNPVFRENDHNYFFDPYSMPGDLSLTAFDEYDFHLNEGVFSSLIDTIDTLEPYTNLHYSVGSYQYSNVFIRHKQYLGNWTIDIHGQNNTGEDGHALSKGNRANVNAVIRFNDTRDSYYELDYEVWRFTYRYYPFLPDTTITRQPKDDQLIDKWTLRRVWQGKGSDLFEAGGSVFWREGHWTPGSEPEQAFNYRIYSAYFNWQNEIGESFIKLDGSVNFHEGFNRRSNDHIEEYSALLAGDFITGFGKYLKTKINVIGGYLEENPYGQAKLDLLYNGFSLRLGGGLFPAFDKYGVYNKSNLNKLWLEFHYSLNLHKNITADLGVRSAQYANIKWLDIGQIDDKQNINTLSAAVGFKKGILSLDAEYRYKLDGFKEMPKNAAALNAVLYFRLISQLYIEAWGNLTYQGDYRQYNFDLENYLMVNGNTDIRDSWQFDVRIAAHIKGFEIFYEGIHLDAFMGNELDISRIRGFEHDLPRYRIGIKWILFN